MKANVVSRKICINKKLLLLFIGAVLSIGAYLAVNQYVQHPKKRAYSAKASESAVLNRIPRGSRNDSYADIILGKSRFEEVIPKEIVPYKLAGPAGAFVDTTGDIDKLYIFDGMNSRILGYRQMGKCSRTKSNCSVSSDCIEGETCVIDIGTRDGRAPDIVIGQPSYNDYGACNRDASYMTYPVRKPAAANTICSMREDEQSYFEGGSAAGMDTDRDGNLYVPDPFNHRVLKYMDPFATDTSADEVWGQNGFVQNECNKKEGNGPDASTLCFTFPKPAVHIDYYGNLWVADVGNNRVLRFPFNEETESIDKQADIVIGQQNFTQRDPGPELNRLHWPNYVTSDRSHAIYVSDYGNGRVMGYSYPQESGMAGTVVLEKLDSVHAVEFRKEDSRALVSVKDGILEFRLSKAKDINAYNVWKYPASDSFGSIGVFSDSSLIFTNSGHWQNVSYYDTSSHLTTLFDTPNAEENGFDNHNMITNRGFHSLRGVAVTDSQIIVSDAHRLAYWNSRNPDTMINGRAIDGYFGVEEGKVFSSKTRIFSRIAKSLNYLWVLISDIDHPERNVIEKYTLPVYPRQQPQERIPMNRLYVLDGPQISTDKILVPTDIYVDELSEYMWVALPWNDRVVRIRMPGRQYQNYTIDAIIGGAGIPDRTPGWQKPCIDHPNYPHSLCYPGSLNEDKLGNLYISDMMLENAGSKRFMIYNYSSLPFRSTLLTLDTDDAMKIFHDAETWKPAFNSQNVMVVGHNPFAGTNNNRFPSVFNDILDVSGFEEAGKLGDYYAQAFSMDFDSHDNLYVAELNRGSLYIYKNPFTYHSPFFPFKRTEAQ